jgi:hypothetical protein
MPKVGREAFIKINNLSDQWESAPSISDQEEHRVTLYFLWH